MTNKQLAQKQVLLCVVVFMFHGFIDKLGRIAKFIRINFLEMTGIFITSKETQKPVNFLFFPNLFRQTALKPENWQPKGSQTKWVSVTKIILYESINPSFSLIFVTKMEYNGYYLNSWDPKTQNDLWQRPYDK